MEIRDTVRMANQIGDFFKSYPEQEALDGIAEHINKFWDPRMRRQLFDHLDNGGEGLDSTIMAQGAVYEDAVLYQAGLIGYEDMLSKAADPDSLVQKLQEIAAKKRK